MFLKLLKLSILLVLFLAGCNVAFASFTISRPSTLNSGLVGHWTFDGGKVVNGVALDSSGNGNNGNLVGIATSTFYSAGKIGQGFNFDGVNDDAENTTIFTPDDNTEDYSVGGWFKADTITGWRGIAGWTSDTDASEPYAKLALRNDSKLHFYVRNDAGTTITDIYTDTLSSDTWYHAAGTKNGSVYRLYLNGVEATSTTATISGTFSSRNLFQTGAFNEGAVRNNYVFDGTIDDVRVYNRALSAGEVKNLYNQGVSKFNKTPTNILNSGLVGHWTFDGKNVVNGVALDSSGNGNNGKLVNIATSTFYSIGKIGQGFRFDGTDDYVDAGAFTDNMETLTVSAWIYRTNNCYGSAGSFWRHIVSKGGDFQSSFRFGSDTCQILFYWIYSGDDVNSKSGTSDTIPLNAWKHVAATYDVNGDRKAHLYIDGEEVSYNNQGVSTGTRQDNSADNLYIGNATTGGTRFFPGKMDDVRVYNRALSAGEVKMLYNMGR